MTLQIPDTADADADADADRGCDLTYQSFVFPFHDVVSYKRNSDNHLGYVGFRDPVNYNTIKNNGLIDIVVNYFKSIRRYTNNKQQYLQILNVMTHPIKKYSHIIDYFLKE